MNSDSMNGPGMAGANANIIESSDANFIRDVIDGSKEALVLVDFWAPWCGPCKQLGPMLEKIVAESGGSVRLVKINIDENPGYAGQLRVQSIPAVFAFRDGKGVDAFMGALPESQIRQFIEKNGGGESPDIKNAIATANGLLEQGDAPKAAELFAAVLQQAGDNIDALAGLARCYLETGDLEHARQTLEKVPANKRSDSRIAGVQASIDLASQSADTGDMEALRARIAADGDDHEARIELAVALNAAGDREGALAEILESIRRDRHWNDDAARARMLTFFESWGPTDPLTLRGRRQLSSLLFS